MALMMPLETKILKKKNKCLGVFFFLFFVVWWVLLLEYVPRRAVKMSNFETNCHQPLLLKQH